MTDYTPTTSEVRAEYFSTRDHEGESVVERAKEFDRWLQKVKAEAWDEGFKHGTENRDDVRANEDNPYL